MAWNGPVMNLTVYSCIILISWLGAHMVVQDQLTTGKLMSLLTYCMTILMNLMMLSMICRGPRPCQSGESDLPSGGWQHPL